MRIGGAEVEVYRFPNDRRLRGLRKFVASEPAVATWQNWLEEDAVEERLDPATLQRFLLRYVPEQKWIARLRTRTVQRGSGTAHKRRVAVRSASPSICATLLNRHDALRRYAKASHTRLHAVRVIGHDARLGLLAVKWATGRNLFEMLREESPADVLRDVAGVIRSLHASTVPDLPTVTGPGLQ